MVSQSLEFRQQVRSSVLWRFVRKVARFVRGTAHDSGKSIGVQGPLQAYLQASSLREPEVLQKLRQETARHPLAGMQVVPEEGQLMAFLVELIGAKKTLEVGVFTGYSTLAVALALPQDGKVFACDISEEYCSIARRYWNQAGVNHKIDLSIAPAVDVLDRLLSEGHANTFDFAFIDADKENYDAYYERLLKLVRPGGLIAIDNVLWAGRVIDPKNQEAETVAIRKLNQKVHHDSRVSISMLPISDGLTLAIKR